MKLITKLALYLTLTLPLAAQAHGKKEHAPDACAAQQKQQEQQEQQDKNCDKSGMDMSKMLPEDHQKMMQQCQHGSAQPKGGS
ncbi:MAG: hypothetical protein ISP90_00040 [Nevskia sp.]|nr:hypothetical protein [Nevskia sp.]